MTVDRDHVFRCSNGFEVLCLPSRAAPVVALELWVRAGSAHETNQQAGLAHLVEHMLFKGTARRGVGGIAREIEAVGGEINAYTSPDHTVYTVVLASRFAELGLDILSDALFCSALSGEELSKEKKVVLEEIRRSRDLPHHYLSQLLFSEAYGAHPYGRPVIGSEESVAGFSRDDCLSFIRRWYRPGNMTLVVAGQFETAWLETRIESLFGAKPPGRRPPRIRLPRVPASRGFRLCREGRAVEDAYFDLAFPGPSALDPNLPAVDVLMAVLGQGEASRLQHRVKLDENLVRSVGAGAYAPAGPGLLYVGGAADASRLSDAYAAICEELYRLCFEPVGLREIEKAKENLAADFVYQQETVQGRAQKAGYFHLIFGDVGAEDRYVAAVRSVTADSIRAAARRYFSPDRALFAILHPSGSVPAIGSQQALDVMTRARSAARPRGRLSRSTLPRVTRRVLPNGARILVHANPEVPLVAVRAAYLGGSRRERRRQEGAFHLIADCLVKGTRRRGVFDIAHEADALGGEICGFSGRNSFGLRAEFLSRYLEDGLSLFAEVLCEPTFPEEELEKLQEDTLGALRRRKENPASYAFRLFERALYGRHPLGHDILGTFASVSRFSSKRIARLFARFARPENLAIAVAGDVDPEEVHAYFTHRLEHLEASGDLPPEPDAPQVGKRPAVARATLPIEQTHVVLGFLGTTIRSVDRPALRVVSSLLSGQGGRLFRRLRDELGLAYSVDSSCVEGLDRGYVAAHLATAPENARIAKENLSVEFTRLAAGDFGVEELEEAKRKLVGSFEISLQENAFRAAQLALDEVYGLPLQNPEAHAASILAVSPQDVASAARRHFLPDRYVCSIVAPSQG